MINDLTIIQNNCLRRIFDVYKTTSIMKLKTETHISFINIHLNELQVKARQRLQSSEHYERVEKIKRKIHRTLKKKKQTKKSRTHLETSEKSLIKKTQRKYRKAENS